MERVQLKHRDTTRTDRLTAVPSAEPASQGVTLTNGQYRVWLTAAGTGVSEIGETAVTRWASDPTCEVDGFHVFLRDLDDGYAWSAGFQPTGVTPEFYEFRFSSALAEIARIDHEVECRFGITVASDQDMEFRRCRLTNFSGRPRRIEITSYLEFVLASPAADANHPAFSKLFVETEYCQTNRAILARRRSRSADEPELWAMHRLLADAKLGPGDIQFETNRDRFLGRGRSLRRPRALDNGICLAGDSGAVLDPIGSLRTVVSLGPGETRNIVLALGTAIGRPAIEAMTATIDLAQASAVFAAVDQAALAADGDTPQWIAHSAHGGNERQSRVAHESRLYVPASSIIRESKSSDHGDTETLQYANLLGGFSADGREYVLCLQPDSNGHLCLPPRPWINVLANEHVGCLVTERGAGHAWAGNSRHNRLTVWHNDPVADPHAEAIWIRDEDANVFWSPLPGPTPADAEYEVRHGFGYTTFSHESLALRQQATVFIAADAPVKLLRLRIENVGHELRRLNLFSFSQWCLGTLSKDAESVITEFSAADTAILARNPNRAVYRDAVAFSAVVADELNIADLSCTGDRASFIGRHGELATPAAIADGTTLDNRTGSGLDPCAAWQIPVELAADETFECTFLIGEVKDESTTTSLIREFRQPGRVERELDQVIGCWRDFSSTIQVETPHRELDLLINGWLQYQNLSCRMWARSAYYQPGGAYGYRDQLQDSAALVYQRPDLTRRQILRHAGQQFIEGDVMHWWHADTGVGLRTRFSDDLVWLPYVTTTYVDTTGDESVFDEPVPWLTAALLEDGQQEALITPAASEERATVYEHCCRALDRSLNFGRNELPTIGCGDWNDGFNRVGQQGAGESVWLGFFLYAVLGKMLPHCRRRDDAVHVDRYVEARERLAAALNTASWDGRWYRRAYFDNGNPLGSAECEECQIDAIAQAWAVLSGVAPAERAAMAIEAVDQRLVDEQAGLIRLLTPPFNRTPDDPGYVKGYVPGVRENGGQYTHGVLWYIRALAEMGRGTRAVELLRMLSPVAHTATAEKVTIYQTEPYAMAADVYSEPPHVGRGGWTWYTGSAGWMFRTTVESILGFSIENGKTLVLKPAISSDWPCCKLTYRLPGEQTRYEITIENPDAKQSGVTSASVDGQPAAVKDGAARIDIEHDGAVHRIVIRL